MQPLPWSFSVLKRYQTCARQLHKINITKEVKEVWSPETREGYDVHKSLQTYLSNGVPLVGGAIKYQKYADSIRAIPGLLFVEREFALDKSLKPCAWFGKQVWGRAKTDVFILNGNRAHTVDHKTGKRKLYTEIDQLMINALFIFAHYPTVDEVKVTYAWLAEKRTDRNTYYRKDLALMWSMLLPSLQSYREAFKLENFPPRPSGLCKGWCPVQSCEFWSPKKK